MRLVARDEQHRTRRDRLDVVEGVEIHELDVTGQGRVRRQFGRRTRGGELAARRAIEVIEFALNRMGILIQLVHLSLIHI